MEQITVDNLVEWLLLNKDKITVLNLESDEIKFNSELCIEKASHAGYIGGISNSITTPIRISLKTKNLFTRPKISNA